MKKLLIITGPTATGKTVLGLELAKKLDGEIISADSRQVYKYMDVGTGKDTRHFQWGIDLAEPGQPFSVSDWVNYANKVIKDIWSRNKLPIIVGGTGQYIKELLHPSETLHIPPNEELRDKNYGLEDLQELLQKTDLQRWQQMNNSDRNNPRRLIRAIEVAGKGDSGPGQNDYNDVFIIGLTAPLDVLFERIDKRVDERMKDIEAEREKLKKYKLPKTIGYQAETAEEWKVREHNYAKRQLAYLKKYLPEIKWYSVNNG